MEEGPFVSFTDLFIGILFLFLILVAALVLMHQQAVSQAKNETEQYGGMSPQDVAQLRKEHQQTVAELTDTKSDLAASRSELEATRAIDAEHPPFRLALVYNEYQKTSSAGAVDRLVTALTGANSSSWEFVKTVQVFRAPNGACLQNITVRNPTFKTVGRPIHDEDIPSSDNQNAVRAVPLCGLTSVGAHYNNDIEEVALERTSESLYEGAWIDHTEGNENHRLQLRIVGIYDDFYKIKDGGGT